MEEFMLKNERDIYTLAYFAAISLVAVWEFWAPRRKGTQPLPTRWAGNFGITLVNLAIIYLSFPIMAVGFAMVIEAHGIGLFHLVDIPVWVTVPLAFIALDLARFMQHYLLHRLPILWRVHRIHHADLDYDFTVGLRFHPIEGLFTTGFAFAVIALIGPSAIIVAVSELVTVFTAMAVHANGRTSRWVERYIRWAFVTPDMHRVHHSMQPNEHNSNYSALFSFWDRLFGTYVAEPIQPHETMEIGLPDLRDPQCLSLRWMLIEPFRKQQKPGCPSRTVRVARQTGAP
ncbi:MAG: sterol desaturase family protein [Rhodospirillaceae bacterium]|jgi:sterol desaturase/sphingolipid hydroxylase (fatty acid hydroxylase superfamily)|nr:sterol desaturase family protein [Rhodospirillaceae bacterium]MBT5459604.1 sterol desaturase family protein [Rhodospirillaceae bacterium]